MKKIGAGFIFLFVMCVAISTTAFAKQPYSSYWFPEQLLQWSPASDPDAAFNRSTIPLQDRFVTDGVNAHATKAPKVMALSALNSGTSGVPSQGSDKFGANTFTYWQYVDKLVYWGGSAGEGIIVPPSADTIDAAHKNGVPIVGTVFFPPTVYGGKFEWVKQMLQQNSDGSFPAADKLIQVAKYYGFDGWFINQETEGGTPADAQKMKAFLSYLESHKSASMQIVWYDSMTKEGSISWQNALNDKNGMFLQDDNKKITDNMFLNFWWKDLKSSADKAKSLDRSPYDLYAGIDVEAKGYDTNVNWNLLFPVGQPAVTSLGIYRPDWTFNSAESMEDFFTRENKFWVGPNGNPGNTVSDQAWKGIADNVVESSPVNKLPFITNFNTGSGQKYYVRGQQVRDKGWNNRSLQDILPTWRWIADSKGTSLTPELDWSDAYYGGSSLKVSGDLSHNNATHLKLYKTDLKIEASTKLSVTYKTLNKPSLKVGLAFADQPDQFIFLNVKDKTAPGWTTETLNLTPYKGKRIVALSLYFDTKDTINNYSIQIGQLSIQNANDPVKMLPAVHDLKVTQSDFRDGIYGDARLEWKPLDQQVKQYEIYRVLPDGSEVLLGATSNHVFYVPEMRRIDKETLTALKVVAINGRYEQGQASSVKISWPAYPKPIAEFKADRTLVAPGESVNFTDLSTEVTEEWSWSFESGSPAVSTSKNPVVTFNQEGVYNVSLTATNSSGQDTIMKKALITVSKEAGAVKNLALGKPATADHACGDKEGAPNAVDGKVTDNSKWCALGNLPHWLQVDLGAEHQISTFIVKHAESGGEWSGFNTSDYTIQVSNDGTNWTDVVNVQGNSAAESTDAIALVKARYVKLITLKPTQGADTAARIYEFEVYGL
ncbi:endo-beta-N-acetylglucosaminidase [Paenibacillus sp. VTT E-133280]|jgi:endo-beta-N-acetylglucosaminidase D/PKD repeat protein|uniref:endo-beta-N-acetylglucosaminidase n=1 Tax=Paenibacillus sp. VTT E-133280 TaxID=1986222 RepID=UPI000BA001CC|nr:discoidin domain-containing protein [Paenibacillus sp. VTT E-133280]OZQ69311.1 endo-beta-N-acetylglucosaminidase [Paenibacillus sp. VTT E-133280]